MTYEFSILSMGYYFKEEWKPLDPKNNLQSPQATSFLLGYHNLKTTFFFFMQLWLGKHMEFQNVSTQGGTQEV